MTDSVTAADKRGVFVAFEGGEGTGKSTQVRLLADALMQHKIEAQVTREPGGTPGAEAIRALLLQPPGDGWGMEAEALLFAAARSDHVARVIRPALEAGDWVICDRFVDSSRAYQGLAGGLGDHAVADLHRFGSGGLRPDVTLLLDVEEYHVTERLQSRDKGVSDAIGGRNRTFHQRVQEGFLALAQQDDTIHVIDGSASSEAVHEAILKVLKPYLAAH